MATSCSLHTIILVCIIVLIIAFIDDVFKNVPMLIKLFTDPINFLLLNALVILILLIDLPCGIILAFLILYIAIYIKRVFKFNKDNNMLATNVINNNTGNHGKHQYHGNYDNSNQTILAYPSKNVSESEFIYKNTLFPNKNLKPFKAMDQNAINLHTKTITSNIACNQNDDITTVNPPNRDGYDITGCRYDFKNSPQNLTQYGPPLASCGAYNKEQIKKCGTVFYPLNA